MIRTKQQLEQIAIAIMDHYTGLPAPECIVPEWGIGIALLRATGEEDLTFARRIEAAFPELMNQFAGYGEKAQPKRGCEWEVSNKPAMYKCGGGCVMSESKHTPGPWEILKDGRSIFGKGPVATLVCMVHLPPRPLNEKDQWEMQFPANARLIAAAPELLEAVKDLRDELCDAECPTQCGHPHCKGCQRDLWKRARIVEVDALIAKAEAKS